MKQRFPIEGILRLLEHQDNFVFLENARSDADNFLSYLFLRPKKVISTFRIGQIKDCFAQLEAALKAGFYVAGFLAYEAGEAFEERLTSRPAYDFPLLWFGVYREPLIYNHRKEEFNSCPAESAVFIKEITSAKDCSASGAGHRNYLLKNIRPNISKDSYLKALAKIKGLIARGFTYQVNFTFKLKFSFSGSPGALYLDLRQKQKTSYQALIKTGRNVILSFSPELFFEKSAGKICARPMKGTAPRGKDSQEDNQIAAGLKNCLKNRSENVMIVDLLRNDLGRISTVGSVKVPRLFNVERYQTLFQMTSDIQSRLKRQDSTLGIFSHIFPSGSVTGAPKIKTMEIIRQLEKEPRNVYTGSIGFFSPRTPGTFNVAIRTLLIDTRSKTGQMGVGSGIVYDSQPRREFAECCLKADFLTKKAVKFRLIETMRWQPGKGYLFLKLHLQRLENSAGYFGFAYSKPELVKALMQLKHSFREGNYKVRLLLSKDGAVKLERSLFKCRQQDGRREIYLSKKSTAAQDIFLYHKTTRRRLYEGEYRRSRRLGFYDVVFTNEKGQITEGAISNIFIKKNGMFYTPPISCGLLGGVYRRYMLSSGKFPVKEKVLFKKDLFRAKEIYLSNSVRGLVRVYLDKSTN